MHESQLHEHNCVVTLTYDDAHLPALRSLVPRDLQLFMKRLRKAFSGKRIRFFAAGEYGDKFGRPHYHICLFGCHFPDQVYWTTRHGYTVWRSDILEGLWRDPESKERYGNSEIGSLTFESAAYVARYCLKKVSGPNGMVQADSDCCIDSSTGEVVGRRQKEFVRMSRRPGIGADWLKRFGSEVYVNDGVLAQGRLQKPPRYYDDRYELEDPEAVARVREKRRLARDRAEETEERLAARETCTKARVNLQVRELE